MSKSSKRKFAAFDIDGTLYRDSLFLKIVHGLISRGHFDKDLETKLNDAFAEYKQRTHESAFGNYSKIAVDILFGNLTKIPAAEYRSVVDEIVSTSYNYCYRFTRDLIEDLRAKNYALIAISGSEQYAVEAFSKKYGFDIAIGEVYEEAEGTFTGNITGVFHRKHEFLAPLVKKHGFTMEDSVAIGDSLGDLTMLEFVENPIVFNPELRLHQVALKRGWKIVVERKNVIYELEPKNGQHILAKAS